MDTRRSTKSRSIGIESKATRVLGKPELGERVHSAPSTARRRQSSSKRTSEGIKASLVADRSSKASIRDDPFFRPYDSPQSVRLAEQSRKGSASSKGSESTTQDDAIPQVTMAVLGAHGVGKSTFVQNSFDLGSQPESAFTINKMSLDDVDYKVRLIEMSLDDLCTTEHGRIKWPKSLDGGEVPSIDGVLTLYDVTNQESVAEIPDILYALHKSKLPCVVVSCKCDNTPLTRQRESGTVGPFGGLFSSVPTYQTSSSKPQSQKKCVSILLSAILAQPKDSSQYQDSVTTRPRAATTSGKTASSGRKRSPDRSQKHHRTRSELPAPSPKSITKSSGESDNRHSSKERNRKSGRTSSSSGGLSSIGTQSNGRSSSRQLQSHLSISSTVMITENSSSDSDPESDSDKAPTTNQPDHVTSILRPATADTTDSQAPGTWYKAEESEDEGNDEDTAPPSPDIAKLEITSNFGVEVGSTFDSLVDRLLALPTNKQEVKFLPIFLCLYRKFASPMKLLTAILDKFEAVGQSKNVPLSSDGRIRSGREFASVGEQLRYLQVLALWTAGYPGDFANPSTRAKCSSFVAELEKSKALTPAAKEISNNLAVHMDDEDAGWAFCDDAKPQSTEKLLRGHDSDATLYSSFDDSSVDDFMMDSKHSSVDNFPRSSPRHSGAPSNATSTTRTGNTSTQSLTAQNSIEDVRKEARKLETVPRMKLSKIQWHQFMEIPDDEFAKELTRIDWTMYSAIRPRDLVRYNSLKDPAKVYSRSLEDVSRMIAHFNHLSIFVEGMILLRDKPKHRAKALEKFMSIAWELRKQNNYNSLASLLAAIDGTAVNRLAQTRALIPDPTLKQFMRLLILMGTQRSHAAYRLAWENSFSERIPHLALLKHDLLAADAGNMTFIGPEGSLINWKKFEIMGQIVIGIQESQERPYTFSHRNEEVLRLVLETKVLEKAPSEGEVDSMERYKSELFARSKEIEPLGVDGDVSRKKFDWFRGR